MPRVARGLADGLIYPCSTGKRWRMKNPRGKSAICEASRRIRGKIERDAILRKQVKQ